jgi:hypothetical protein
MLLVASCGYEDQRLAVQSIESGDVVFETQMTSVNANGCALSHDNKLVAVAG